MDKAPYNDINMFICIYLLYGIELLVNYDSCNYYSSFCNNN